MMNIPHKIRSSNYNLDWIIETLPSLESSIVAAFEDFNSASAMEKSSSPGIPVATFQPDEISESAGQPPDKPSV